MSTVNVQPITSVRAAGNYALYGAGVWRAERHLEALEGHPWRGCTSRCSPSPQCF